MSNGPDTKNLRSKLEAALPERPFNIDFWDGGRVEATEPNAPTFTFTSVDGLTQILRAPGELGVGRAYVTGAIDVDDLDAVMHLLGRWKPAAMSAGQKAGLATAAVRTAGFRKPPPPPAAELQPGRKKHSIKRDSEAVRHHYDVSNEFFELFLDKSMTYSCGLFLSPDDTLEQAQFNKLDLVCRKLELTEGTRLLDIGCGWGSMAMHAAREYGASVVGITLSPEQAKLATDRVAAEGLSDKVEVRVQDYRELRGEKFQAISSIGMIEHVGDSQIDEYSQVIADALEPGGRVLNHGITWTENEVHIGAAFSERYVFPDAEVPPLSRVLAAFERAHLEPVHIETMHQDYAKTLQQWVDRLDSNLERALELVGPERLRVWRLYLRAARNGFETGITSIYQSLLVTPEVAATGVTWARQAEGSTSGTGGTSNGSGDRPGLLGRIKSR